MVVLSAAICTKGGKGIMSSFSILVHDHKFSFSGAIPTVRGNVTLEN